MAINYKIPLKICLKGTEIVKASDSETRFIQASLCIIQVLFKDF